MTPDASNMAEIAGSAAAGAASAITAMYKLFVPRGEAREYRKGVEEHKKSTERRLDNCEFALSKAITRETLDDVMGPMKEDLKEIKQLLRGSK